MKEVVKLSSNENPLGCSPKARAAFARSASMLHVYPDVHTTELCQALAETYHLQKDKILCSAGSDELISLVSAAFSGPGSDVIVSQYGFLSHRLSAQKTGAHIVTVPEKAYRVDLQAMLKAVTKRTRLIYLANPNNPTGSFLSMDEIKMFHKQLDPEILLVLDSAYAEYMNAYDGGAELVEKAKNVIMLRTFSKVYGLAALRIGWGYMPQEILDVLNRIRLPFNVNLPAQSAAISALEDQVFVARSVEYNREGRDWLMKRLLHSGYELVPGYGNFLLVHFPQENGKTALDAYQYLAENGFITRPVQVYGLLHSLRISIGQKEHNATLADLLDRFLNRSLS